MRIGHGYDTHVYADDRLLILGGVTIPYEKGLAAHSDGDAVIHAVCDALLGAAALGDIGAYFPDTKAEFKNIDSRILLRQVFEMTVEKAMSIVNIDITILAQAPKMAAFIHDMRRNIASDLETDIGNVNIKASTTEGLGFVGRKEGIAVHAVVLLA
ncbi:MAG: 2-C-methyl-D-erythritol 2,4-cyclodiphosphate synthase [Gammaproteobacteria bacterium]